MAAVTNSISLTRENLLRYTLNADFFEKVPALQVVLPELDACKGPYLESKKKSGCGCNANVSSMLPCLGRILNILEEAKTTDPTTVQQFVEYVAKRPTQPDRLTSVTIYFGKEGEILPTKYEFIA